MFKKGLVGVLGLLFWAGVVMGCFGIAEAAERTVSLPDVSAEAGAMSVVVPVEVSEAEGIAGALLRVTFNPAVIQATGAGVGELNPGWMVIPTIDPGSIGLITTVLPLRGLPTGSGSIVKLIFDVVGSPGQSTDLIFAKCVLNDELEVTISSTTVDGKFTIQALPPEPVLDVTPTDLDFGTVAVGQSRDLDFTVTNTGTGTLTGSAFVPPGPFSIVSGSPFDVPAGANTTVTVQFAPTAAGLASATVAFTSIGGNFDKAVSGVGTKPELKVDPTLLEFGTTEARLSFAITNPGTGILRWEIEEPIEAWLLAGPIKGDTTTETDTVKVAIDRRKLAAGFHFVNIRVKPENLPEKVVRITVEVEEPLLAETIRLGFTDGDIRRIEVATEVYLINPLKGIPPTLVITDLGELVIGEGYRAEWLIWEVEDGVKEDLVLSVPAENDEVAPPGQTKHLKRLPLPRGILEAYEPGISYEAQVEIMNKATVRVAISYPFPFRTVVALRYTDDEDGDGIPDGDQDIEIDEYADGYVDTDEDRVDDRRQDDIATLRNLVSDVNTAVQVVYPDPLPLGLRVARVETLDARGLEGWPEGYYDFPDGLYSFRIEGLIPGSTIHVKFHLSEPFEAGDTWWKYDSIHYPRWRPYATAGGYRAGRIIAGVGTDRITLEFVDGGYGDADGVANSVIVDPSGPGRRIEVVPPPKVNNGICFIATAAFGTPLAEEVEVLRRLRDEHLLPHPLGRTLVSAYERISPPLAELIREESILRKGVRIILRPLIWMSRKVVE